ncbi:MAG TPA: sorbosone dehydrogenase family protein [Steroidobacteraceae bacterium]|nr:sorbosone dehydrogenase family protein [Steroidobacteraceae bacterium]
MSSGRLRLTLVPCLAVVLGGCGSNARLDVESGTGPNPTLPAPRPERLPTIAVAEAVGWPDGHSPTAAPGLRVTAYARDLAHPRWLYVLPNGDVLVAETAAPERPAEGTGLRGRLMLHFMRKAGSVVPSADRITLLRDADGDGVAETRTVFLDGLHSPFGMTLVKDDFYVANTDSIVRFEYRAGTTRITTPGQRLVELPAGPRNHHWTKNVIASPDGSRLYATVGSNSNVAENGMQEETGRAAIWEVDRASGRHRLYATGLRNPNGLAWVPETGALWTAVNERDEIGGDLAPDYMTSVRDGGFYGWPYSYFGPHVDDRVEPPRPDLVATALVPDYALGPHTASLGLAYASQTALGEPLQQGMFVGQHGSWNRKPRSGYRVIFVPFRAGVPAGPPVEVLGGFVDDSADEAYGRPVGVALDRHGALLVADDVGNAVWRVTRAGPGR